MEHHFNVEVATKYGVGVAIFLNNMQFWTIHNCANEQNYHDGRYWTYNSVCAFAQLFPYYTAKQVRSIIDKCEKEDLIIKGNYNSSTYDRTSWYSLTDKSLQILQLTICPPGQMKSPKRANEIAQKGKSIRTDIKPDIKTNKKQKLYSASKNDARESFEKFWNIYPRKKDKARALKVWVDKKLHEKSEVIISKLSVQILNESQWKNPQFIPYAERYLRWERWEDEITLEKIKESPLSSMFEQVRKEMEKEKEHSRENKNFLN